jgi:hypothetical protein
MSGLSHQEQSSSNRSEQSVYPLDAPLSGRTVVSILADERSPQRRRAAIERVVEADIIPRLLAAYRKRAAAAAALLPKPEDLPSPRAPTPRPTPFASPWG